MSSLLTRPSGNPAQLSADAGKLRAQAQAFADHLTAARAVPGGLSDWSSGARSTFDQLYTDVLSALSWPQDHLNQMATVLDKLATGLSQAQASFDSAMKLRATATNEWNQIYNDPGFSNAAVGAGGYQAGGPSDNDYASGTSSTFYQLLSNLEAYLNNNLTADPSNPKLASEVRSLQGTFASASSLFTQASNQTATSRAKAIQALIGLEAQFVTLSGGSAGNLLGTADSTTLASATVFFTPGVTPLPPAGAASGTPSNGTTYTVKAGDSFWAIAGGDPRRWRDIVNANGGFNSQGQANLQLQPGMTLVIPATAAPALVASTSGASASGSGVQQVATAATPTPGSYYTVRSGDTLSSISQRAYGAVNVAAIANDPTNAARLKGNPNLIYAGEVIFIPALAATGAGPAVPATGGAATNPPRSPQLAGGGPRSDSGSPVPPGGPVPDGAAGPSHGHVA